MTAQAATLWRGEGLCQQAYPYRDAAFALADRFPDHPAVRLARTLHSGHFSYDAPVAFALCHGAPPAFQRIAPYDPTYVVARAGGEHRLDAFATALRQLAADSDFRDFLAAWRPFHTTIEAQAAAAIDPAWVDRLHAYAGMPPEAVRVCLAPLARTGFGYGPTVALPEGTTHFTVAGPLRIGADGLPRYDDSDDWQALLLHEGAHGFVNRVCDAHTADLEQCSALYQPIAAQMRKSAYPTWQTAVYEHVVRAVVARLSADPDGAITQQEGWGFRYVRPIATALEAYEQHRDRYRTFADFGPSLVKCFADLARDRAPSRV